MPDPILVVDDDPDIRAILRLVLEEEGYPVALAGNGEEALLRIAEQPPGLILLDLHMPAVSGWDLYAALKGQHSRIPVLIMTAGSEALAESTRLGAAGCLPKPFDVDYLLRTVARFAELTLRYERVAGLTSRLYYVYDGERYVGVVNQVEEGRWQALAPNQEPLGVEFVSREEAGRVMAARARNRQAP